MKYMPEGRGVGAGTGFVLCHTRGHGIVPFMCASSQIILPTMGYQWLNSRASGSVFEEPVNNLKL